MPNLRISDQFIAWVWQALGLWAVVATVFLSFELAIGPDTPIPWIVAGLSVIIMIFLKWRLADCLPSLVRRVFINVASVNAPVWYGVIFIIGFGLRFAWLLVNDIHLISDGQTYFGLAGGLIRQHSYRDPLGQLAYWPPGYPFFLMPFYWVTDGSPMAIGLSNILLYVGTYIAAVSLACRFFGDAAGRSVSLILAIWPNLILLTGVASKEMVLVLLLPLALLILYSSPIQSEKPTLRSASRCIFAGMILGFATLVQPSYMLMPIALFLSELLGGVCVRKALIRTILIIIGLIIVVMPWSIRNVQMLGQVVLVSTNGGDVFYRANNPLATGGYVAHGEVSLNLPELEKNREGYRLGLEWIKNHPIDFLQLAVRKQVLFLGDDAAGAYESLKRGRESGDVSGSYALIKAFCNGFWLMLWIAVFLSPSWRIIHSSTRSLLLMAVFAYPLAIDSIFESGGRHHVPVVVILALVVAANITQHAKVVKVLS